MQQSPIEISGIATLLAGITALVVAIINAFSKANKSQVDGLVGAVETLQKTTKTLREENERLQAENRQLRQELQAQYASIDQLRTRVDSLETERAGFVFQVETLTRVNQEQAQQIQAQAQRIQDQAERICYLESENTRLEQAYQTSQARIERLEKRRSKNGPTQSTG